MFNRRHCFFSAIILIFVLPSTPMFSVCMATSQETALSTIVEAQQQMAQAYEVVLDAEGVGADVSGLLAKLNDAAELLSWARMAYEVDNFEEAVRFAELSSGVGLEVEGEADRLIVEASQARVNRVWWSVVGSVFVLFLPGYSLIRALFGSRELDNIERFALSVGLSLALVPWQVYC